MRLPGVLACAIAACAVLAGTALADPFVTRDGAQLVYKGKPFRFTGLNVYNANSRGDCWYALGSGTLLSQSLDHMGPGVRVIRAWFFQDLATTGGVRDWSAFDHTLEVARAHHVKVIATLANQWADCEPAAGAKTAAWYAGGYRDPDPGGTVSYRDWVAEVVSRYRNDSAILAWQLVNEPEVDAPAGGCAFDAAGILRSFTADVSGLVKSIDRRHLVSVGVIGSGQCGASYTEYADLHALPTVDLCTFHDYSTALLPGDRWNGLAFRLQQCAALGKPLLVDETGVDPAWVGGGLEARADLLRQKLDAQFAAGVAGELVWAWDAFGSLGSFDVGPGDPVLALLAGY